MNEVEPFQITFLDVKSSFEHGSQLVRDALPVGITIGLWSDAPKSEHPWLRVAQRPVLVEHRAHDQTAILAN